ncbi:hypothetical protein HanXRQr2_Chr16g0769841 [Helianthus annuus]|uniref:Uncharacterized protein n=1 Tax=Helianthus annuus TaxID=4232 RepID=A0A9K3GZM7_HELAN|nr:hypothetical protein HanXRQr2_Chr16g0769841 [Helianthus annuus]KAJ0444780.1 hypothetical protein HanIR_Chr16g0835561 [Helianthus annuus]KAJ0462010.1 hypothetical protein HanHA89_Chr16g0678671 [Helianthus annuus]KAJ0646279.1 hypothetical protein HanOQP8_Chr16g0633321 [Helianthus annuus]KAJ0822944.1 hypothetical protein HanPSC8_Chr16g0737921 [Helianthus annuus]
MLSLWFAYSRFASNELIPNGFLTVFFLFESCSIYGCKKIYTLLVVCGVYIDLCWPNFSCYQSW